MDRKKVTQEWIAGLRIAGLVILGPISLFYSWYLCSEAGTTTPESVDIIWALEKWLALWRGIGLFILGFLTLGYTWAILIRLGREWELDEVRLPSLRKKWLGESA